MSSLLVESKELKPFLNHLYELKKGVRRMVLYTINRKYEPLVLERLKNQNIDYHLQPVGESRVNVYFGKSECVKTVCKIIDKPLNLLSPEEDFILGALLGYDLSIQCERYCKRKN